MKTAIIRNLTGSERKEPKDKISIGDRLRYMKYHRILNFIENSIFVFDQATCLQVGVSGEARFPNAFPISRSESHNIIRVNCTVNRH